MQGVRQGLAPDRRHARRHLVSPVRTPLSRFFPKEVALTPLRRMTLNTPETAVSPTTSSKTSSASSSADPLVLKWERRKKSSTAYAPSLRSGCTMAVWAAKNMGVLFGGVTDEDTSEETLESVFHCDLYGYQIAGNGRWVSMLLKRPKRKGAGAQKKKPAQQPQQQRGPEPDEEEEYEEGDDEEDGGDEDKVRSG